MYDAPRIVMEGKPYIYHNGWLQSNIVTYIITQVMKNESRTIFFAVKRVQKNM